MLISTAGFAVMTALIKHMESVHLIMIIFFRCAITAGISTNYLLSRKISLIGTHQTLLVARAIVGLTSMSLFFITIQRIPLGASMTLKYLAPFFALVMAALWLKEKILLKQWILFGFVLFGVWLLKGHDTRIDTLNLMLGLGAAFFGGAVYVIIRKIGVREHPLVIVNYFMTLGAFLSGIALFKYWSTPTLYELCVLLLIGIVGYIGQKFMTASFQKEETNVVAPLKYLELVYAYIIGYIIFSESYPIIAVIGILIIIVSFIWNYLITVQKKKA